MANRECCPNCGADLPLNAPQGLCPACLLEQAMQSKSAGPGSTTAEHPPDSDATNDFRRGLRIGDLLQKHLEIRGILRGGMGEVYIVHDLEGHSVYAVKTFRDEVFARNPTLADRFAKEALAWVNLGNHQNIVRAHYLINIRNKPYLFLDYIPGGDLQSRIGIASLSNDLSQVLHYAMQFCDGMIHAGSNGIKAHRDIKPQNCLVTPDGTLKVTDFGLAKVYDDIDWGSSASVPVSMKGEPRSVLGRLWKWLSGAAAATPEQLPETVVPEKLGTGMTQTGLAMGTATHMAPEQFLDAKYVDVRADIYSFGVMLFQMITGRLPFRGQTWQEFKHLHRTELPPTLKTPQPELNTIVQRCLCKDPEQRFADFGELRERLAANYTQLTGKSAPRPVTGVELDSHDWFNRGLSMNELDRPSDALACYDRALLSNPGLEEMICLNKGNPLAKLGRHDEAVVCYDRALALNPNLAVAWVGKGNRLAALARYQEAIACYERATLIGPRLYQAFDGIGMALRAQGEDANAINCFDKAIALNPQSEITWVNKAAALSAIGNGDAALACCQQALKLIPDSAQVWAKKAELLSVAGDRAEEALACYERTIELDPRSGEGWLGKGLLLALEFQDRVQALECLEQAQKLGDPRAAEAIKELNSLERPTTAVGYTLHLPNSSFDSATGDGGRGLVQAMDQEECLSLALGYLLQGRIWASEFPKAQAMAQKAVEVASRWPDAWVSKGIRCHAYAWFLHDPQAALGVLGGSEAASKLFESNSVEKYFTTGIGALCGRRYDEALEALKAAERLEQNNPFINVCIAVVRIEQEAPDAHIVVNRCCSIHKGHPLLSLIRFNCAV
jgi:serine/threonine protein kinase/Flp pilus assembly protein TadD